MKRKLEYIWLDGYTPEPNLRSKIKIVDLPTDIPEWSYDGSSTQQAEGNFSDCILKPVKHYNDTDVTYVFCEVYNPDGTPHSTNTRHLVGHEDEDMWFGFEQEYFIVDNNKNRILGHDSNFEPQGKFYCGIGGGLAVGRSFVEEHLDLCLKLGINITGINAEVALGQWEYQVFSQGKLAAGDDLWMTRYLLIKLGEKYNYKIDFHPKPLRTGDWNGSGLHCNFSTKKMREESNEKYFSTIFRSFELRHKEHIDVYGSDNQYRLTGKHETQSIDKFSWGIADRGASIRVPLSTSKEWKGYIEDRRPASNADPYKIVRVIYETLAFAEVLDETNQLMYSNTDPNISTKVGADFLNEYTEDDDLFEMETELMESRANVEPQEIDDFVEKQLDTLKKRMADVIMNAPNNDENDSTND